VATGEESAMAGGGGASPSCAAVAGWTVTAVLLQVVGLSMFLYGFFPVKPTLPGFSGAESYRMPSCGLAGGGEQPALPPDQLRSLYRELSEVPPVYDRLVLMVCTKLMCLFFSQHNPRRFSGNFILTLLMFGILSLCVSI
jgi:hypothetical protein